MEHHVVAWILFGVLCALLCVLVHGRITHRRDENARRKKTSHQKAASERSRARGEPRLALVQVPASNKKTDEERQKEMMGAYFR